jgi:hypothetical protein
VVSLDQALSQKVPQIRLSRYSSEVGEDEDGDGSFVGTTDGGDWLGWLRLSRWSDLTMQLAGLRRSDLRRDKN